MKLLKTHLIALFALILFSNCEQENISELDIGDSINSSIVNKSGNNCTSYTTKICTYLASNPSEQYCYYETRVSCSGGGGGSLLEHIPNSDEDASNGGAGFTGPTNIPAGDNGGGSSFPPGYDRPFKRLCPNIDFKHSASSFKAEIASLGSLFHNERNNMAIDVILGVSCVDIPEYYISTSYDAAAKFVNVFENARIQVRNELEAYVLAPNVMTVRARLVNIITRDLQSLYPGATFGRGSCLGDVPRSIALFKC